MSRDTFGNNSSSIMLHFLLRFQKDNKSNKLCVNISLGKGLFNRKRESALEQVSRVRRSQSRKKRKLKYGLDD